MSNFHRNKIAEKIPIIWCDNCLGKKRTNKKFAMYKIYQVEDKTLYLCRDCFIKYNKIHDVKLKKVVDFSSNPLNIPDEKWLMDLRNYWKSFREFGNEEFLDFRKSPGFDWVFMTSNFRDYLELSDEDKKEFQISYKFSPLAPAIDLVVLDWKDGTKIGYSHEGEIICKILSDESVLFYSKRTKKDN